MFIIVAESMVILRPIDQFGWRSACFEGRGFELLRCPGAERPARRGQNDALDIIAVAAAERLKQRVVLAVDRQDRRAGRRGAAHEEAAGANQTFLVGKRDRCAALDRGKRRLETGRSADRGHQPVDRTRRRFLQSIRAGRRFDSRSGKRRLELGICRGLGHDRDARLKFARKLRKARHVAPGTQRLDREAVAIGTKQINRARADRAGRAKDGDAALFRCSFWLAGETKAHRLTIPAIPARAQPIRRKRYRSSLPPKPPPKIHRGGP